MLWEEIAKHIEQSGLKQRAICRKAGITEQATGQTRNAITDVLERVLADLVRVILMTYDTMREQAPGVYAPVVTFQEYGAPDFDSRVETVGNAAIKGIMSIETQVRELWGKSKKEDWIMAEVARLMAEKGIETIPKTPGVGDAP